MLMSITVIVALTLEDEGSSETSGIKSLPLIVTKTPDSLTSELWKPNHRQRHAVPVQHSVQ